MSKMVFIFVLLFLFACNVDNKIDTNVVSNVDTNKQVLRANNEVNLPKAKNNPVDTLSETSLRFPCGDEVGHGYYIAQGFQDDRRGDGTHLGLDINGVGGGNSDLGDTIYSIGNGIVAKAEVDCYLAVYYKYKGKAIKALYYHCLAIFPKTGDYVAKGEPIATIGDIGADLAHLHFELIKDTNIICGFYGYPEDDFYDPMEVLPFYKK